MSNGVEFFFFVFKSSALFGRTKVCCYRTFALGAFVFVEAAPERERLKFGISKTGGGIFSLREGYQAESVFLIFFSAVSIAGTTKACTYTK